MNLRITVVLAALVALTAFNTAEAKTRHTHHHYAHHRGGSCDGIHRCICGTTAADEAGLPWDYNGWNLKKASEWRRFPHASFASATHAIRRDGHHVMKLAGGSDCASAIVHDERGTYPRNVCDMTLVSVGGTRFSQPSNGRRHVGSLPVMASSGPYTRQDYY